VATPKTRRRSTVICDSRALRTEFFGVAFERKTAALQSFAGDRVRLLSGADQGLRANSVSDILDLFRDYRNCGERRISKDRDESIIVLLITEQVGSIYAKLLVFSASFCVAASAAPFVGATPAYLIYAASTFMVLASALALFPLRQRLFNFFALDPLISGEILPALQRHIKAATAEHLSGSLANHHYARVETSA